MTMNNLDPALVRQILAAGLNGDVQGYGLGIGNYTGPSPTEANDQTANRMDPNYFERVIYGNGGSPSWTTNTWDTWNTDGTYRGSGSGDSDLMSAIKFAALAAAGYGIGTGIESLGGAASTAGAAPAATTAATTSTSSTPWWQSLAQQYGQQLGTSALAPALNSAANSGSGETDWGQWATNEVSGASQNPTTSSQLNDWARSSSLPYNRNGGFNLNLGSLLGAAAGALDGRDKTATSSKEPWAPAQPALLGLLARGQELASRPAMSEDMRTAYGNASGLLDFANRSAPALFAAAQANASGANNYSRLGGPRPTAGGLLAPQFNLQPVGPVK